VALAGAFAIAGLWPSRRPRALGVVFRPVGVVMGGLLEIHRAHVGDYVSWTLVGFTVLGATLLLT
jgi:hypothetical protein